MLGVDDVVEIESVVVVAVDEEEDEAQRLRSWWRCSEGRKDSADSIADVGEQNRAKASHQTDPRGNNR